MIEISLIGPWSGNVEILEVLEVLVEEDLLPYLFAFCYSSKAIDLINFYNPMIKLNIKIKLCVLVLGYL